MNNQSKPTLAGVTHHAARYFFRNFGRYSPLLIAASISYWLADSAILYLSAADGSLFSDESVSGQQWAFLFSSLISALISAAIAVPVHNYVLNGPFRNKGIVAPNTLVYWSLESGCYLLVFVSFFILTNMTTGTTVHIDRDGAAQVTHDAWWMSAGAVGVIVAGFLASLFLSTRMVTLLPHVAVTEVSAIRWSWAFSLSKGHFWGIFLRFMAVGLLTAVPAALFSFAYAWVGDDATGVANGIDYLFSAINALTSAVFVLFFATLASFSFLKLSQNGELGLQE